MRAYEVQEPTSDYEGLVEVERERPTPGPDEALVRVRACSLNYRDLGVASSEVSYGGVDYPVVPLSDAAGEVVEVGDDAHHVSVGDRVATPFAPLWIDGPGHPSKTRLVTGGSSPGVLAEFAAFPADSLAVLPDYLSLEGGASLSCGGLTAWRALVEDGGVTAGETVLTLGTGGVSTFALQFATLHGARVVVTSSSDAKLERARELGADETVNYVETPDWGDAVYELTDGVDQVIEVGGAGTFEQSLAAAGHGATVHLIGVLAEGEGGVDPHPIPWKMLTVNGVFAVGSRAMFDRMLAAMAVAELEPLVDTTFDFGEAREAFRYLERGEHQGKVVIAVD